MHTTLSSEQFVFLFEFSKQLTEPVVFVTSPMSVKMLTWNYKSLMSKLESLKKQLKTLVKGRTALVGVGNVLKADDGTGPLLIGRLRPKLRDQEDVVLFDAGVTPENHLGPIIRSHPDTVIVIDAMDFGGMPGGVRLFIETELAAESLSTHAMNPEFFIRYLKENGIQNILLLGIQPGNVDLGREISPEVEKSINSLAGLLREIFVP